MNLKNNTPRMHHITPFETKNSYIFWEGAQPIHRPHPSPPTAPIYSRVFGTRPATPQCFSGVDAHDCDEPPPYALNVTLPAFADERQCRAAWSMAPGPID